MNNRPLGCSGFYLAEKSHSSCYWFGYLNFVADWKFVDKIDKQLKILWLSTFIDKFDLSIDNYRQISSTIDLSTTFSMIDFDQHVTSWCCALWF